MRGAIGCVVCSGCALSAAAFAAQHHGGFVPQARTAARPHSNWVAQSSCRRPWHRSMSMVIMDPTPSVSSSPVAAVNVRPSRHDTETGRDPTRVKIFDTTLRDGEQSPGCTMTREEKLVVARQLSKLGVDVIEAGFPIASPGDFEAVKEIAETVGTANNPPIICGLARALKKDIDVCAEAVRPARFPRIHTFIATSDIHMEHKLKKTREQVLAITHEMVSHAKSLIDDVEFSAEDALRSDPEFLAKVFSVAIAAGASTINVPDTVGYTTPGEFKSLIHYLREHVAGIDGVTISVHGHNDLGMAVANFLAAIEGGARQVECTVNGIGERAGNAALEEIVMALHVRKGYFNAAAFARPADSERALTNVVTQELYKSSRLVSSMTGMTVQANKAIVGANAFAHESGIHQDGVLKNKETYEIMDAALVGVVQESNLVLGKHSGRHAFRSRLAEMGYTLADDELNKAFARFKDLADKKKEISVLDLESIVNEEMREATGHIAFALRGVQVLAGNRNTPTATVIIHDKDADTESHIPAIGTGPVDATFQAINAAVAGHARTGDMKLLEYSVDSVTAGIDALGEVTVRVQDATTGRTFFGRGADTDVIYASAMAYVDAINRIVAARAGPTPKHPQKDTSED